jgi:pimeloyl-ACP methyl ester carboxylesterase
MPFVTNVDHRIHYEVAGETVGDGPALLLHHGMTQSTKRWYLDNYVDALSRNHRLVMVDARGHGLSDKPHESERYSTRDMAADVVAVLDELALGKVIFWGYSLGARIGFELAALAPERVCAYILGGGHPFARRMPPGYASAGADGSDPLATADTFLARIGVDPDTVPPVHREALMANDFKAIAAAQQDRESVAEVLPTMQVPCLVYAGAQDSAHEPAQRAAAAMPQATFASLPGLEHSAMFRATDAVLAPVQAFLSRLASGACAP